MSSTMVKLFTMCNKDFSLCTITSHAKWACCWGNSYTHMHIYIYIYIYNHMYISQSLASGGRRYLKPSERPDRFSEGGRFGAIRTEGKLRCVCM
jgi:hypothetical protein